MSFSSMKLFSKSDLILKRYIKINALTHAKNLYSSQILLQKKNVNYNKSTETDSFIINMFCGNLNLESIFPYPNVLNSEQKETLNLLVPQAIKLYQELNDPLKNDETGKLDPKVVTIMKDMGAFGIGVPTEYGGAGMISTQFARLAEIIGSNDLAISVFLGAHQSIGYKGIVLFGTEEQKKKYLPDLVTGKSIASFCLTEPDAGSDASSIKTTATLSDDGQYWILNGNKIWISNSSFANIFTVFAKTKLKNSRGELKDKVSAFIVERSFGGITNGTPEPKMGIRCSNTCDLFFENVKIPKENVLGELGNGFKIAMNILNSGRFGMVSALSGSMKALIAKATEHATTRQQFGSKLATFGTIQEKLARMSMKHYICESIAYMIAGNMDRNIKDFQLEAAIGKVLASEYAWQVCDETIQILGGTGYMRNTGIEKVMRDLRIFRIFEGANEILRLFIVLTGLQHTGIQLKEFQKAMKNPVANFGMIFDQGNKRVFRKIGLASGFNFSNHVTPQLEQQANEVSKNILQLSKTVENLLIKYNKDIIHEQFVLNRLADAVIDIYIMLVVLSRATNSVNRKFDSSELEINMVKAICLEKCDAVKRSLNATTSSEQIGLYKNLKEISEKVTQKVGVATIHPVDEY